MNKILLVEDDDAVRRTLELYLTQEGYAVETAVDGREGVEKGQNPAIDLVLLDLRLPEIEGLDVLRQLKAARPALNVIVITAFDDMQSAIESIKLGADDHLGKPLDLVELDQAIAKIREVRSMSRDGFAVEHEAGAEFPSYRIIGRSPAMKKVFKAIGAVVNSTATVLLHGESGTGKEMAAKAIHASSPRAERPFVAVTCSVLTPTLIESELFGHEKGAFTGADQRKIGKFELADGGTLLLDEISEVPLPTQVKLLRFLQEREFERVGGTDKIRVDVRVVAATNRDLEKMVREGTFRKDLYYRLNVVTIGIPPLRERTEDLPLLVRYLLQKIGAEVGKRIDFVPEAAMERLSRHPWPGNVRELENSLRRALLLSAGGVLLLETLQLDAAPGPPPALRSLDDVEKEHIEKILRMTGYEKKRAAAILKISRPTLDRRIREYGIQMPGS